VLVAWHVHTISTWCTAATAYHDALPLMCCICTPLFAAERGFNAVLCEADWPGGCSTALRYDVLCCEVLFCVKQMGLEGMTHH